MQAEKKAFEDNAKARATANSSSRYGQQEVCQISGLIINSEETRVRDHKMGRNYRCGHQTEGEAALFFLYSCFRLACICKGDDSLAAFSTAACQYVCVVIRDFTALLCTVAGSACLWLTDTSSWSTHNMQSIQKQFSAQSFSFQSRLHTKQQSCLSYCSFGVAADHGVNCMRS